MWSESNDFLVVLPLLTLLLTCPCFLWYIPQSGLVHSKIRASRYQLTTETCLSTFSNFTLRNKSQSRRFRACACAKGQGSYRTVTSNASHLTACLDLLWPWEASFRSVEFLRVMEQTAARVLSQLGSKDQPSKEFQSLIRHIGEAKTKHVSLVNVVEFIRFYRQCTVAMPLKYMN